MAELVQHLVERLQPGADGKPKVFRDSLVRGMEEWLSDFSARNLAQDGELSSLVERARELLHPVGNRPSAPRPFAPTRGCAPTCAASSSRCRSRSHGWLWSVPPAESVWRTDYRAEEALPPGIQQ